MTEYKVFNDPVHGHFEVHPLLVKIIDTPQFQRLRYIKQLGTCYFVFPGASHNRFEHSLGVGFLAGELVRQLQRRQPDCMIEDKDVLCVEIAGLCHDLGHGPFSHFFDGVFIPLVTGNKDWKHEHASVKMFEYLVEVNDLELEFQRYGLFSVDLTFIKEQIAGPSEHCGNVCWPYKGRPREKGFLYEIVANKRNGIDVDKWDYFARDCHHLGIKTSFDHNRFMKFARVLEVNGSLQICSRDKEVGSCYDMFYTRNVLHRRAYQHKNTKIIEFMISEAMLLANEFIRITNKDGKELKISETIHDMSAYTKLNDGIFHQILYSSDERLREAREILDRLEHRELYRFIGQTKPVKQEETLKYSQEEIRNKITEFARSCSPSVSLNPSDIIVNTVRYDYGMRNVNPVDHVRFYEKSNPDQAIHVRQNQVSAMLPRTFSEQHIQVYYKKRDAEDAALIAQAFQKFCENYEMMPPKSGDPESVEMTPDRSQLQRDVASNDLSDRAGVKRNIFN